MGTRFEEIIALGISERQWMRHLPPLLADIARIAGIEAAFKIGTVYGGQNLHIPVRTGHSKDYPVDHLDIARVVGVSAARKLISHFNNGEHNVSLGIPPALNGKLFVRMQALRLFEQGESLAGIAGKLGVSRSIVIEWKARYFTPYMDGAKPAPKAIERPWSKDRVTRKCPRPSIKFDRIVELISKGYSKKRILASEQVSVSTYYLACRALREACNQEPPTAGVERVSAGSDGEA